MNVGNWSGSKWSETKKWCSYKEVQVSCITSSISNIYRHPHLIWRTKYFSRKLVTPTNEKLTDFLTNLRHCLTKVFGEQWLCRNVCEYVQNPNTRLLHQWIRTSSDNESKYVSALSWNLYSWRRSIIKIIEWLISLQFILIKRPISMNCRLKAWS